MTSFLYYCGVGDWVRGGGGGGVIISTAVELTMIALLSNRGPSIFDINMARLSWLTLKIIIVR